MMLDNSFYSHRKIFQEYCNLKKEKLVFGGIQHGWLSEESAICTDLGKRSISIYPFFCWSENLQRILLQQKIKNTYAIGAPFLYLDKLREKDIPPKEQGTIVFPSKCHFVDKNVIRVNHEELIRITEAEHEPPYTASLFHTDMVDKTMNFYKKKNWKIISFGERLDPNFLYTLYNEIKKSKNCIFTSIVSPMFYAFFLKKNTTLVTHFNHNNKLIPIKKTMYEYEVTDEMFYKNNYQFIYHKNKLEQKYLLSLSELGFSSMKKPDELKLLFGWDSFLKQKIAKIFNYRSKVAHKNFFYKKKKNG